MSEPIYRSRPGGFQILPASMPEAREIREGIYVSEGLSNSFLVTTSEGRVVINTGMGFEAPTHKRNYDAVDDSPIRYILLTQGHVVSNLVNFISKEFRRVYFHGSRAHLISRQAQATGISLRQHTVPPDMSLYEQTFKKTVSALRCTGIQGMVFGDIYLQEHQDWVESATNNVKECTNNV